MDYFVKNKHGNNAKIDPKSHTLGSNITSLHTPPLGNIRGDTALDTEVQRNNIMIAKLETDSNKK